jgi:FeS assembly protein IscX
MSEPESELNALYWDSSYEIVLALMARFPDIEVDTVGTEQMCRWIIGLPNFADDPAMVNEGILNEILREWYEEVNS